MEITTSLTGSSFCPKCGEGLVPSCGSTDSELNFFKSRLYSSAFYMACDHCDYSQVTLFDEIADVSQFIDCRCGSVMKFYNIEYIGTKGHSIMNLTWCCEECRRTETLPREVQAKEREVQVEEKFEDMPF